MRVVVLGGGYAGLACVLELRKRAPGVEIDLVDPAPAHLKVTHLHETLRRPLDDFRKPFGELGERFGFTHHQTVAGSGGVFGEAELARWQHEHALTLGKAGRGRGPTLPFDYLVVATGASPVLSASGAGDPARCFGREELQRLEGQAVLDDLVWPLAPAEREVAVVGGGASGVQFAFELAELMRQRGAGGVVRLLDRDENLFPQLPAAFRDYVVERMSAAGIEYLPQTEFVSQQSSSLRVRDLHHDEERELPAALSLLFAGARPHPLSIATNAYGQVQAEGETLGHVFAAGDCSRFAGNGLNAPTAQAAVRKGKHVAVNISRARRNRALLRYGFAELGYVVSLGTLDAVGWMLVEHNVLKGLAAFAVKELVAAQYDLFVEGVDTYLV